MSQKEFELGIFYTESGTVEGEAQKYIEAVAPMANEKDLLLEIESELRKTVEELQNIKEKVSGLYYCCGPAPFLYHLKTENPDLYSFLKANLSLTGIDLNNNFIDFNTQNYPEFTWENTNAVSFESKNQISILNSSYHHIPDNQKSDFMKNIARNLTPGGRIIMGENFLSTYAIDESGRKQSVDFYYDKAIEYYRLTLPSLEIEERLALAKSINLMEQVRVEDITKNGEFKNHVWIFLGHLKEANLELERIIRVWPVKETLTLVAGQTWEEVIPEDFYGSSVFIIKKII